MTRWDVKCVPRASAPCRPVWPRSRTLDRRSRRRSARRSSHISDRRMPDPPEGEAGRSGHTSIPRRALQAARREVHAMRASKEIGDDAFHQMEEDLDWIEMADGSKGE